MQPLEVNRCRRPASANTTHDAGGSRGRKAAVGIGQCRISVEAVLSVLMRIVQSRCLPAHIADNLVLASVAPQVTLMSEERRA